MGGFENVSVRLALDPFHARNPGFCFVDFESEEEANRAIAALNGREILGRPVRLGKAVPARNWGEGTRNLRAVEGGYSYRLRNRGEGTEEQSQVGQIQGV